eukprot:365966-Chlamydomonas_euryale.AAC.13
MGLAQDGASVPHDVSTRTSTRPNATPLCHRSVPLPVMCRCGIAALLARPRLWSWSTPGTASRGSSL